MIQVQVTSDNSLIIDGQELDAHFTKTEANLLHSIVKRDKVSDKWTIMNDIYGGRDEPDVKILEVLICKIRNKLDMHRRMIVTVWGRGYKRHEDYIYLPTPNTETVSVDSDLLAEVAFAADQRPDELIHRLLKAEKERLWRL